MKNIYILSIVFISLLIVGCSFRDGDGNVDKLAEITQTYKIGYLDVAKIIVGCTDGKQAKSLSDARTEKHKKMLNEKLKSLHGNQTSEYKKLVLTATSDMKKFQDELLTPILKKLEHQVDVFAAENHYDIIFDANKNKSKITIVLYNEEFFTNDEASLLLNENGATFGELKNNTDDITQSLIKRMDSIK